MTEPLTFAEIQAVVSTIKYKGMTFSTRHDEEMVYIDFSVRVQDTDMDYEKPLHVSSTHAFSLDMELSVEGIIARVWHMVSKFEYHEAGEHFIVDGERPYHPHHPMEGA